MKTVTTQKRIELKETEHGKQGLTIEIEKKKERGGRKQGRMGEWKIMKQSPNAIEYNIL